MDRLPLNSTKVSMNKSLSLALLAGGIVLALFGVSEMNAIASDVSRLFTGAPTDRSIWMIVGGVGLSVFGLAGLLLRSSKN